MPHRHPDPTLLRRLLRGEGSPAQLRGLVWHLAEACPDCATALNGIGSVASTEEPHAAGHRLEESALTAQAFRAPDDGDFVVGKVRAQIQPALELIERDRSEAPALFAELDCHPIERQRMLVRNRSRFQTLAVAELVLESAWDRRLQKPEESESLISLALELTDCLDSEVCGEGLLNDLRGRAWSYRGNLLRIRSELRESNEAFRVAAAFLAEGTGDPLETARLLGLTATLRRLQFRFDEAAGMIQESLLIYRSLGEDHLAGRTMVTQALLLEESGDPAGALEVLRKAQDLIEPTQDAYLVRVVQQNTVTYLMELGRYEEAMGLIPALRRRMVEGGSRMELLRLRWQEGRILMGLGHETRAEAAYLEVRKGFTEEGVAHDAAAVSLELAGLYLRQGRTAEIRELARQMVPIFQSRDLHQEAIAALLLFQRSVEMDTLTLRMVEEVSDAVRRAQGKPRAKQEEPS